MLTRLARPSVLSSQHAGALFKPQFLAAAVPNRGFATEQQLKQRIVSIGNIAKITGAMKMVSAAKLRRSQNALDAVRDWASPMDSLDIDPEQVEAKNDDKVLLVAIASDKGLCGAINSVIVRQMKVLREENQDSNVSMVLYGEKAKLGLERLYTKNFTTTYSEMAKIRERSFDQVASVAQAITEAEFDRGYLVYNYFKSMLAYETRTVPLFTYKQLSESKTLDKNYKLIGQRDVRQCLHEFRTAVRLQLFFSEADTAELSSRMNAMSNSSKNAGEMLEKITLLYNRTRQAKITTELIEIISGASAAEEQVA